MTLDEFLQIKIAQYEETNLFYNKPTNLNDWYSNWDFSNYNANIYNHGLHQYPARFIPQLARKLLKTFCTKDSKVLDIFSGSGTTLLECKYLGINEAYGIELNPFAIFMAKTKLQNIDSDSIKKEFENITSKFNDTTFNFTISNFNKIDFWYSNDVKISLSKILNIISQIQDEKIKNFFLLVFCDACKKTSYLDTGTFKMYRSKSKIAKNYNPNAFEEFSKIYKRNLELLEENNKLEFNKNGQYHILQGDSRIKNENIAQDSIDFILTSPPYGDSRTTVAYGQYSTLPWKWLKNNDEIVSLDRNLLGGTTKNLDKSILDFSETLKNHISNIEKIDDSKRENDVIAFYKDLYTTLENAHFYLKQNCYFILVTGNRTVKNEYLRTDLIISEFAKTIGFSTEKILTRNIINKRMASKNSPTNQKGKVGTTMLTENIIILKKN